MMIVQPDFPDHWKTKALVTATGDPASPMMIIRLWAHCQFRRRWHFENLSDSALAGVCGWTRNPAELKPILKECGFIEGTDTITVHDWEKVNGSIIARWKGGDTTKRQLQAQLPAQPPAQPPVQPPAQPLAEPLASSSANSSAHGSANSLAHGSASSSAGSDKRRGDKIREEERREDNIASENNTPSSLGCEEGIVQHAEAQLGQRIIAKEHFHENLGALNWGSEFDAMLNNALPMPRDQFDALMWLYRLPKSDAMFNNPSHPAYTKRRQTFTALMQNLKTEAQKALELRERVVATEEVELPAWPRGMEAIFREQWPERELPGNFRELSGMEQDLLFDLRRKKNAPT